MQFLRRYTIKRQKVITVMMFLCFFAGKVTDMMLRGRFQTAVFLVLLAFTLSMVASETTPETEEPSLFAETIFVEQEPLASEMVPEEDESPASEEIPDDEELPVCPPVTPRKQKKVSENDDDGEDDSGDDDSDDDLTPEEGTICVPPLEEEPNDDEQPEDVEPTTDVDDVVNPSLPLNGT